MPEFEVDKCSVVVMLSHFWQRIERTIRICWCNRMIFPIHWRKRSIQICCHEIQICRHRRNRRFPIHSCKRKGTIQSWGRDRKRKRGIQIHRRTKRVITRIHRRKRAILMGCIQICRIHRRT